jgi:hypothetical protein
MKKLLCLSLAMLLICTACKKNENADDTSNASATNPPVEVRYGFIEGYVVAANGTTLLPGVNVFVDDAGTLHFTRTNSEGKFLLKSSIGTHTVHFQSGHGTIFRSEAQVTIEENVTHDMGMQTLSQQAALAYIQGQYDDIQTIIIDSLGYTATQISVADLASLSTMSQYQAIFLNCGKSGAMDSLKYANLHTFVANGGSLYASDWAVNYLSGDGNFRLAGGFNDDEHHNHTLSPLAMKTMAPCPAGDIGGFIADTILCSDRDGASGWINQADVLAQDLQNAIGGNLIDVEYNLGSWESIKVLDPVWEVLVRKTTTSGQNPLAIRLNYNNLITGGGNGPTPGPNQVTICHIPPGNPNNPQTITINQNALQAHLNHGDQVGPCGGNAGKIIYTTFHNHPGGHTTPEIKAILQHFILNL